MKQLFVFSVLFTFLLSLSACDPFAIRGRGDLITETRNASDFHAIELNISGDVEVRVDSFFKVEVTCEENLLDILETEVVNGVLRIDFDRNVFDADNLRIRVTAPAFDKFEIHGSGDIKVLDKISGTLLDAETTGSGDLDIFQLDFQKIKLRLTGSGDASLAGVADDLNAAITGSGDLEAFDCPVKTATINISGSGDVEVDASETLDATISGSGDVRYQGNPVVNKNISGSGSVRKAN